jgi:hypothetical protein
MKSEVHRFPMLMMIGTLLWVMQSAGQSSRPQDRIVAKAGATFITESEFLERFELLPGMQRHRSERLEESKLEVLYSLIAEKLMAEEAHQRGLDKDSTFQGAFEEVRKLLARDELYRDEVSGKVTVSASEISAGVAQALKEVLVSFIFCDRREDAEFIRKQIKGGRDFKSIELDTSLLATRDTATIVWGDAVPAIEQSAYTLKIGEISRVIPAGTGFYILMVERTQENVFYSSMQSSTLTERVASRIRQRKEETRLNEFVAQFLKGKSGYSKPGPLKIVIEALSHAFRQVPLSGKVALSGTVLNAVREECASVLGETLCVAGNVVWKVGDVLDRLSAKGFALDSSSVMQLPQHVNGLLRVWVQQELLAQEALKRGLDSRPAVRKQLDAWRDNLLEQSMRFTLRKEVRVSDAEILSFIHSGDSSFVVPKVRIRELRTGSLDDMHKAFDDMKGGTSFEEAIVRWCSDELLSHRKGISDPFPVSERYPIGEIAWQMLVGQRYGPVKEANRYVYFELLSKDSVTGPADTAVVSRERQARNELSRQKEKRLVNLLLAKAGQERGYTIYQDQLSRIKVSTVPMMTFRILGFGGRMFAVPFVDRQIEWLNVEPPAGNIVF